MLDAKARLPYDGLLERLLDDAERARLVADIDGDATLALINRLAQLLPTCDATPEQIERLLAALPADGSQDGLFETILYHPAVAEPLLFRLLDEGRYIATLGHRRGPQRLLERLAAEHGYDEAITTLALDYYGRDDQPLGTFLDFVRQHRDRAMLAYNLRRTARLAPDRQRAALAILDET